MARVCDLTHKKRMVGNNVSHAQNKTKKIFQINLIKKSFYIPEKDAWVKLKVAASTLRTINKLGISAVLKEASQKGHIVFELNKNNKDGEKNLKAIVYKLF